MGKKKQANDRKLKNTLRTRYKLVVFHSNTYEEIWTANITKINVLGYAIFFLVVYTGLILSLMIFTPVNQMLPAYHDSDLQQSIIDNAIRVDSLEYELQARDRYLTNLRNIIEGKPPIDFQIDQDTLQNYDEINFEPLKHDSVLQEQIDQEGQMNRTGRQTALITPLSQMHFFAPAQGMVINNFAPDEDHYGIDIVSEKNESVLAVLDGTVISADWTLTTGYVIRVQHGNNILSCYKHNSVLLKESGDQVKAGEPIAIIGNTGELTTGPHLHFELWHEGTPLNPEDYVIF